MSLFISICVSFEANAETERTKEMAENFELGDVKLVEVKQPKEEAKEMEPSNSNRYFSPFLISITNLQGIFGCISSICEDI